MSDVTTGTAFNPQFFMNPPWWIGRIESKEIFKNNIKAENHSTLSELVGWGHRYNVRIFNWHTGDLTKLPPEKTVKAQVVMPVTAGSGHGGASETPSLQSGSVVFGFFMDGMAAQEPYITGVLGNSNNNVPKERGKASPAQSGSPSPANSKVPQAPIASSIPKDNPPPKNQSTTGPGSRSSEQLPNNIDSLSIDQLKKFLTPARTPNSVEFKAASEARQKARANKLPPEEVERQVLIATVKASRSKEANIVGGNCNLGYQNFNDTYSDSNKEEALVPDFLRLGQIPNNTTDALHTDNKAKEDQQQDKLVYRPLLTSCNVEKSGLTAIQVVLENLINKVESIKREIGNIQGKIGEFRSKIKNYIDNAADYIASLMTPTIERVRSYILTTISKELSKVAGRLFPSLIADFNLLINKIVEIINCLFQKLVDGLIAKVKEIVNKLINKLITVLPCAVQNFVAEFLNGGFLDSVLNTVKNVLGLISAFAKNVSIAIPKKISLSSVFDYALGIVNFFGCEVKPSCVDYNKLNLAGLASPITDFENIKFDFNFDLSCGKKNGSKSGSGSGVGPEACMPPKVKFFGGGGSGAKGNVVVNPKTKSIIAIEIVDPGSGYKTPPKAVIIDNCGKGGGASLKVIVECGKIKSVVILNGGDGYISRPDGSVGGNGKTWAEVGDCYRKTSSGEYYLIPNCTGIGTTAGTTLSQVYYVEPNCGVGTTSAAGIGTTSFADSFTEIQIIGIGSTSSIKGPPFDNDTDTSGISSTVGIQIAPDEIINLEPKDNIEDYSVILDLENILVDDPGFGYNEGDEIIINPNNGTVVTPVINSNGGIESVIIVDSGFGFNDIPEMKTNSLTGFNLQLRPILKVRPLLTEEEKDRVRSRGLNPISVIDCVGKVR